MKKGKTLVILLSMVTLASCNSQKGASGEVEKTPAQTEQTGAMQTDNNAITEKYWKLVELEGQQVVMNEGQQEEAHFILKTDSSRVTGSTGCNYINGEYTLEEGNRIRFSNFAATMRSCAEVPNEHEFLEVFELTDNYTINGDTLMLNVGRRAPLAVFHAVYMK